jgi:hypothetical protein
MAGRGNRGGVDKGTGLDRDRPGPELAVTTWNNVPPRPRAASWARSRMKPVRSGVGSWAGKPQKRRSEARSSTASASRTSDRSCQTVVSMALKSAKGGQAGSPFAGQEMSRSWRSTGAQPISSSGLSKAD